MDKRHKFSRRRNTDSDTELITYINEKNRVFNKKVNPFHLFLLWLMLIVVYRLLAFTINTQRRLEPVSKEVQLYDRAFCNHLLLSAQLLNVALVY
jgi:hypothetical protein